jgi:hypothetical protein
MTGRRFNQASAVVCAIGIAGCIVGALMSPAAFQRAWLCSTLFWLGLPLAGVTLVLVHDLTGGDWMETARPGLEAAIMTMPVASLAGIASFVGLGPLYTWTRPAPDLGNVFYLNPTDFFVRYAIDLVMWNLLAAFALWGPRAGKLPIAPGLSWISGIGLVALALSSSFAAIDWILSLEPTFWSSIFPYAQCASWFNTGIAIVILFVTLRAPVADTRKHMADLARIMLATTIFWAYLEFMQFLIIWEENLKTEIPWYLKRLDSVWYPAIYVSAGLGFVLPFLVLLWGPSKRHRGIVAAMCVSILLSRLANTWLLVMPEFADGTPLWLDFAAVAALGGVVMLLFGLGWRSVRPRPLATEPAWTAEHG